MSPQRTRYVASEVESSSKRRKKSRTSSGPPCRMIRKPDLRTRSRSIPNSPVMTIDTCVGSSDGRLGRFNEGQEGVELPSLLIGQSLLCFQATDGRGNQGP